MTESTEDEMSADDKRRDQLLRAENSTEADAAPRIVVSKGSSAPRIDIADTAAVRPGPGPGMADASRADPDTDDPDADPKLERS